LVKHPSELNGEIGINEFRGLNVTFINMPLRESAMPNTPPEGPAILASILRRYGATVHIIDLNGYRFPKPEGGYRLISFAEAEEMFMKHINQKGDQDLIAFSGMITTLRWQENVAEIVKAHQPRAFLVTGGGLATEIKKGLFNWIPELDGVAHSEGDDVIISIAKDAMVLKEEDKHLAKLSSKLSPYRIGEYLGKERFIYGGSRPKNLDTLPYASWDLLESDPYGHNVLEDYISIPVWGGKANNSSCTSFTMDRSLTTVSSRGCPYACAFCYRGAQGERNYGIRSPEHIAKQMRDYVDRYKVDFIGFPDDNFAVSVPRINKMVEVFSDYGFDRDSIRWGTHTRLDEADERVKAMSKSGCIYIGFGAESASKNTLTRMNKGGFILKNGYTPTKVNGNTYQFPTTMFNGIRNCRDVGIHANCTWIMSYPKETLADLKTSVAFIVWQQQFMTEGLMKGTPEYKQAFDSVNRKMFTVTAYPGTAMFKDPISREMLTKNFNITYEPNGEPVCNESFHAYVLELDDATKVLHNKDGVPLNFGAMSMDNFLQAREHIDTDNIEKILEMSE